MGISIAIGGLKENAVFKGNDKDRRKYWEMWH